LEEEFGIRKAGMQEEEKDRWRGWEEIVGILGLWIGGLEEELE
jgi:hypothetical protein